MSEEGKRWDASKGVVLPVALIISVLGGTVAVTAKLTLGEARLAAIERQVQSLSNEVNTLAIVFEDAADSRWRRVDMKAWALELAEKNTSIAVPPVRDF